MVPYGAPFVDVNNNGTYEPAIDTPGVKNAASTIFICMTDGFQSEHSPVEGFGGGTLPLYCEVHLIAWCYTQPSYANMQFIKYIIINKATQPWTRTYFSIVSDPDLGYANDDYIGCDTSRKLGYCYNSNNNDPIYGTAPPAVGFILLKGAYNKYSNPPKLLNPTAYNTFKDPSIGPPPCEEDPNPDPIGAHYYMEGYKRDSTSWLDPTQLITPPNFYKKTKFLWPGDPETNIGWTEYKGCIQNCGLDSSGNPIIPDPPGDKRLVMNSGAENLTVMPGDTQTIVICQLIAKGTSNLYSVTKLKQLADVAINLFNNDFEGHTISGVVKFADNNQPVTNGGYIKAIKLDGTSGQIITLDSTGILPDGTYTLPSVPIDSVDIGVYPNSTGTPDFVMGYYPTAVDWQQAIVLYPTTNLTNINISVYRLYLTSTGNSVNGKVYKASDGGLKEAYIYAKSGNNFVGFGSSDGTGRYHISSLPSGSLKVIAHRLGFSCDSLNVNLTNMLDSINFYLNQMYVGIKNTGILIPEKFNLYQNYPNPFNPVTKIKFEIPSGFPIGTFGNDNVVLKVYDILGKEIITLVNEKLSPGSYEVSFDGNNLSSGIYFYRLIAGDFIASKKMILIK
jgi:hypothetical protein